MNIKRLKQICKSIDRDNADDLLQDTFIRLNGKYEVNEEYYAIFRTTAKNLFINKKKAKNIATVDIDSGLLPCSDENYNPSLYKKALDNFLIKKKDTIFADIVEYYLLKPNIKQLVRDSKLPEKRVIEIFKIAKNEIGIEYIRLAGNNDSDSHHIG